MSDVPVCDVCKKPMVLGNCYKCRGSGKISTFGLFRRTCPVCKGAKQVYHCTNYGEHERIQHPSGRQ